MKSKIVLLLFCVFVLASCEKVVFKKDIETTSPYENFDYLWEQVDKRYAYFDYKNVDWDAMYAKYASRLYDGMSEDSLFNVMGDMLDELRDGHVNLISPFNISRFDIDFLGPENIDDRVVTEYYLGEDRVTTGPFSHDFLADRRVGYIRYRSFTGTLEAKHLDYMLDRYKDTEGLIFDIRQNGGGAVNDVYGILRRFIKKEQLVFTSRGKTGPGHNEFGEIDKSYLGPAGDVRYTKKIMVLTDRGTYSSGSVFSLIARELDNMMLMGDTTGGGLGLPNGGQLPNGWTYRCSITQMLSADGENFEDGIPPDVRVIVNPDNLQLGIDDVIEAAIKEIL